MKVSFGRSLFIVYSSTAAQLDEATGNAFTRHVCEAIADPAFSGLADPELMALRDAEKLPGDHPSLVFAFDPTRFVRTVSSANLLYDVAARNLAAFEARDLRVDPALGEHMRMMWMFLAYGSEMEATVGKLRRFVGRLNKARAGLWPYRVGMTPLGVTCADAEGGRRLTVDDTHVDSVARLVELGLNPATTLRGVLTVLGTEHGVVSTDPKAAGVPVNELDPAAVKRLFLRRKLRAYRDGALELVFVGVMENQLRPGSGHVLTRRWEGLRDGTPDRYGSISYHVPMPKPTVTAPDGSPRQGWLDGMTDEQERATWDRLILLRGVDDDGRRPAEDLEADAEEWNSLSDEERAALNRELGRARSRGRGGRPGRRAVSVVCPAYRDSAAGEAGPRTFLRARAVGASLELRRERTAPADPYAGLDRDHSNLLATFDERTLTDAVGRLITEGIRRLTDEGHHLGPYQLVLSPALAAAAGLVDPAARRQEEASALSARAEEQRRLARGYEASIARLLGQDQPSPARLADLEAGSAQAWAEHQRLLDQAAVVEAAPPPAVAATPLPQLDASDPRDLVVGLRRVYGAGPVPEAFLEALRATLPTGVRFTPAGDLLEWQVGGDLSFTTENGEVVRVLGCQVPVTSLTGRGGAGGAADRAAAMAVRRMVDGHPIEQVAAAAGLADAGYAARSIGAHLNRLGRFPDPALLALAVDCPIVETTRVLHEHATADHPATRGGFAGHVTTVYTRPAPATSTERRRNGRGHVWAYDPNTDSRADQLTILAALPAGAGIRATALAPLLDPAQPVTRHVLNASTTTTRTNAVYPPALRRLPAPGHPDGWHGKATGTLPDEHKLVGLPLCPHPDCAETYATALCPAVEVLALGAMMLCRRCRRANTPADHPQHQRARQVVFPQSYIDWADAQPRRSGQPVPCAAGCSRDVGLGAGLTWRWDDSPEDRSLARRRLPRRPPHRHLHRLPPRGLRSRRGGRTGQHPPGWPGPPRLAHTRLPASRAAPATGGQGGVHRVRLHRLRPRRRRRTAQHPQSRQAPPLPRRGLRQGRPPAEKRGRIARSRSPRLGTVPGPRGHRLRPAPCPHPLRVRSSNAVNRVGCAVGPRAHGPSHDRVRAVPVRSRPTLGPVDQ